METGSYQPSFVSRMLKQDADTDWKLELSYESAIKWTAAALYIAGMETTMSTLSSFILAMTKFPEVQLKAQNEIDSVIGTDRLPQLQDREKLPYIEGILMEAYRWSTVIPMGLPHASEEDIVCNGYLVPKGAYLLPAIWWFCHDPDVYAGPGSFDPERYRDPRNEPDPRNVVFGFGRRICPGQHFADSSIFITVAQILAAFKIRRPVDENGIEIDPTLELTPGIASHPKGFPYNIAPRSTTHAELIRAIEIDHPQETGDSDFLEWTRSAVVP